MLMLDRVQPAAKRLCVESRVHEVLEMKFSRSAGNTAPQIAGQFWPVVPGAGNGAALPNGGLAVGMDQPKMGATSHAVLQNSLSKEQAQEEWINGDALRGKGIQPASTQHVGEQVCLCVLENARAAWLIVHTIWWRPRTRSRVFFSAHAPFPPVLPLHLSLLLYHLIVTVVNSVAPVTACGNCGNLGALLLRFPVAQ